MPISFEVLDCIDFWARYRSRAIALSINGRAVSYRDLSEYLRTCTTTRRGENGRIALLSDKKADTTVGILAALRRGQSVAVLNPLLTSNSIGECVIDAKPQSVLCAANQVDSWRRVATAHKELNVIDVEILRDLFDTPQSQTAIDLPEREPTTEWAVLYSSGSTGTPKGIERDYESMHTEFLGWCLELGISSSTRFYVARPVYYTGGLVLTMATLLAGGTTVLNEISAEVDDLIADLISETSRTPIDWLFIVPDQIRALLSGRPNVDSLRGKIRNVLVMGAPVSGDEKQRLAKALGCEVRESWGNSESLGTITEADMLLDCPDSIGRPFLGDYMCVVREDGSVCAPMEIGRIAGGDSAGFKQYTAQPEATAEAKRDGLIISEDLGWQDEVGRFYIAGRVQEAVSLQGKTVFLPKIEADLRSRGLNANFCLAVRRTSAVPQIGMLFEEATQDADGINAILIQSKMKSLIEVVKGVAKLPRTASGKLDRNRAADLLWS